MPVSNTSDNKACETNVVVRVFLTNFYAQFSLGVNGAYRFYNASYKIRIYNNSSMGPLTNPLRQLHVCTRIFRVLRLPSPIKSGNIWDD